MNEKNLVVKRLAEALSDTLDADTIENLLETPKSSEMGDVAFPCFALAKSLHQAPAKIAADLTNRIDDEGFEKVVAAGPYVNFFLDKTAVASNVIGEILELDSTYGDAAIGDGRNVVLDMSSPNIAKPFSIGHLRSTVIADALANIYQKIGYNPIRINHLGDWGKQFGLLMAAYKHWGDEEAVKAHPIDELAKLYVRINKAIETDPALDDEGRAWFLKLENGDAEATQLWTWFREESLTEFQRIYDLLDVRFDSMAGEAFYNDKMDEVVQLLDEKGLTTLSDGATIVNLDKYDLPPALIKASNGATLYITRDIAAALYRERTYDFAKALYVVGSEQQNHFKQLVAVLTEMGFDWAADMVHVWFGMVTRDGKKISSRKGNAILLEPTLLEAIDKAGKQIDAKNPALTDKAGTARAVGVGAVKFYDLKTDRTNGYDFNLEEMISFEGETGPYVQYAHARICSILRKAGSRQLDTSFDTLDAEAWELVKLLQDFPNILVKSAEKYEPSLLAKFSIRLAQAFNKYYAHTRILDEDAALNARLALVKSVSIVLRESLRLLGIAAPDEM